jgi:ribosome-associated toxin RatA of RatAB toxin-antitoxin module
MSQRVRVEACRVSLGVDEAFDLARDFPSHAMLSDAVRSVTVEEQPDGTLISSWKVNFRKGTLVWKEIDELDFETHTLRFRVLEGDPDAFEGAWTVREDPSGEGCVVAFEADFDIGIPTLRRMIEPIAVSALQDNIAQTMRGVFGESVELNFASEDITALR